MSITQDRMLALIHAAYEYRLARARIIEGARDLFLAVARKEADIGMAMQSFDALVESVQISEVSVAALVREETHFKLRKADNDRRRIKQGIKRFEKFAGNAPQKGVSSEKIYSKEVEPPRLPRIATSTKSYARSTAPKVAPASEIGKPPAHYVAPKPGTHESYVGFGAAEIEMAREQIQKEDRVATMNMLRRMAAEPTAEQLAEAQKLGVKTEKEEIAEYAVTPDPEAFKLEDGKEDEDDFGAEG